MTLNFFLSIFIICTHSFLLRATHECPLINYDSQGLRKFIGITNRYARLNPNYNCKIAGDDIVQLPKAALVGNGHLISQDIKKRKEPLNFPFLTKNDVAFFTAFNNYIRPIISGITDYESPNPLIDLLKISHARDDKPANTVIVKMLCALQDTQWLQKNVSPYVIDKQMRHAWPFLSDWYKHKSHDFFPSDRFNVATVVRGVDNPVFFAIRFASKQRELLDIFNRVVEHEGMVTSKLHPFIENHLFTDAEYCIYKQARDNTDKIVFIAARNQESVMKAIENIKNSGLTSDAQRSMCAASYLYMVHKQTISPLCWRVPKNTKIYAVSPHAERIVWVHPQIPQVFCDIKMYDEKGNCVVGNFHDLNALFDLDHAIHDVIFVRSNEILLSLQKENGFSVVSYNLDTKKMYLQPAINGINFYGVCEKKLEQELPIKQYSVLASTPLSMEFKNSILGNLTTDESRVEHYRDLYSLCFHDIV